MKPYLQQNEAKIKYIETNTAILNQGIRVRNDIDITQTKKMLEATRRCSFSFPTNRTLLYPFEYDNRHLDKTQMSLSTLLVVFLCSML